MKSLIEMDYYPIVNHWIFQTAAMAITALLLPRLRVTSIFGPLLAVLGIAFVNATVWDAALFFKTPDAFHTQAMLLLLANGVVFFIVVKLMPGIEVKGILPAILAPVIFTISSLVIEQYGRDVNWDKVMATVQEQSERVKELFRDDRRAQPR